MSQKINLYIAALADYAIEKGLLDSDDRIFAINRILDRLELHEFSEPEEKLTGASLEEILKALLDYAVENGIIEIDSVVFRDLFDTELMGLVTPLPSVVNKNFFAD
jgi:UDPglucose--hexose-1-phosphate uridylyltransferase